VQRVVQVCESGKLNKTLDVMQEAYSLPDEFHQDPADRIIVATARIHDLTIITGDLKIVNYPHVKTIC
jgi:PIN domain nuclease of toxin-antitoxin system